MDRIVFTVSRDDSRIEVVRPEEDLDLFTVRDLHGDVIADLINGDGGILPYLADDCVEEVLIQPFTGLRMADRSLCSFVAFKGEHADSGVEAGVVIPHVAAELFIKLTEGTDSIEIEPVDEGFLQ